VAMTFDTTAFISARSSSASASRAWGKQAFADDRLEAGRGPFPFDRPERPGCRILVCEPKISAAGSSREHAPQSLMRWGSRAVVGESFAEIFFLATGLALGFPCLQVRPDSLVDLQDSPRRPRPRLPARTGQQLSLEGLPTATALGDGAGPRHLLLSGSNADATSQLVAHDSGAARYGGATGPYFGHFAPSLTRVRTSGRGADRGTTRAEGQQRDAGCRMKPKIDSA